MVASKQMLLGVTLLLTHVHLHAADGPQGKIDADLLDTERKENSLLQLQQITALALYVLNDLNTGPLSMNERGNFVEYFEYAQHEINEQIKNEPSESDKQEVGLRIIGLCQDAKHKLWEGDNFVLP